MEKKSCSVTESKYYRLLPQKTALTEEGSILKLVYIFIADLPGFEPGQGEPKSSMLPLHQRSMLCRGGGIRTPDPLDVNQMLLPAELRLYFVVTQVEIESTRPTDTWPSTMPVYQFQHWAMWRSDVSLTFIHLITDVFTESPVRVEGFEPPTPEGNWVTASRTASCPILPCY